MLRYSFTTVILLISSPSFALDCHWQEDKLVCTSEPIVTGCGASTSCISVDGPSTLRVTSEILKKWKNGKKNYTVVFEGKNLNIGTEDKRKALESYRVKLENYRKDIEIKKSKLWNNNKYKLNIEKYKFGISVYKSGISKLK